MKEKKGKRLIRGVCLMLACAIGWVPTALAQEDDLLLHLPFDEGAGALAQDASGHLPDETIRYVFTNAKAKASRDPEWRANGILGGGLLFDGYSTYLEYKSFSAPASQLTVSAWVAPRAFEWGDGARLSTIAGQYDEDRQQGFALGLFRHGRFALDLGTDHGRLTLWDGGHPVARQQWSHIAGVFDGDAGFMRLYLNGELIAEQLIEKGTRIIPAQKPLRIGKNNKCTLVEQAFDANMFSGIMDDLRIYGRALSGEEIGGYVTSALATHGGEIPALAWDDIRLNMAIVADDRDRPQYHAMPPQHWLSEPNAPFYYNGKYHLFYQHNPIGPYWHQIHWGHMVSDDMVHWTHLPEALWPEDDGLAPDAIWSGNAFIGPDGVPTLFYTAGNDSKTPFQCVAVARPKDLSDPNLTEWVKDPVPAAEQDMSRGMGMLNEFRDACVWLEDNGMYYMVVCSGVEKKGGCALIFESPDMKNWEYRGQMYEADPAVYPHMGRVWELPLILPTHNPQGEKKYIFIVDPFTIAEEKDLKYWIGDFDTETCRFTPDDPDPQLLDLGKTGILGPCAFTDPKTGRNIIYTIDPSKRTQVENFFAGWTNNISLPTHLSVDENNKLVMAPIEELQSLRMEKIADIHEKTAEEANALLQGIGGDMLEIRLSLQNINAVEYGITVRKSPTGREKTELYYSESAKGFYINRMRSGIGMSERSIDGGDLTLRGDTLELILYLDRSVVEAFVDTQKKLTSKIYPTLADSLGIEIYADDDVLVQSLEIWALDAMSDVTQPAYYPNN